MLKSPKIKEAKIIVIVGPTASGKSDLAVRLAKWLRSRQAVKKLGTNGAEIISADSRQVYHGMNIGTGKITKKEMRGIPHHLLDVASPKNDFNVSHFKKLAAEKIEEITAKGKIPIVIGGTGFWIDALIYDWPIPEVGPDPALRARLEKKTSDQLFAQLKKLDPNRAQNIDPKNKRRLIRALEILAATGKPMAKFAPQYGRGQKTRINGIDYKVLLLGIKHPQKKLQTKIRKRLLTRFKHGMIAEIKKLHRSGVSWKRLDNFGLEYRYISRYLRGLSRKTSSRDKLTYEQMVEVLYSASCNYAKRQITWLKRNPQIHWVRNTQKALSLVRNFIL